MIENTKITNYLNDNTQYGIESNISKLIESLENDTNILQTWFKMNEMKLNNDKCHLLIIFNSENNIIKVGEDEIIGSKSVKLLDIPTDNKLNFNDHVTKICMKENRKLHALKIIIIIIIRLTCQFHLKWVARLLCLF